MTTAIASWNFSRKRTSSIQVSSGRPHMLTSNQRGRGNDPVVVLGKIRLAVAVNMRRGPFRDGGERGLCSGRLFRCGQERRGGERVAPPEPPPKSAAFDF